MNERIQELVEQARLHSKTVDADRNPQEWMDEYHKKFAELIVQECMSTLYLNGYDDAVVQIQKHFGVEQ